MTDNDNRGGDTVGSGGRSVNPPAAPTKPDLFRVIHEYLERTKKAPEPIRENRTP